MRQKVASLMLLGILLAVVPSHSFAPGTNYYEIRIYTISDKDQEGEIDGFLKEAYLPALHRAGINKVGVFKPVETDTVYAGKRIYVLVPYPSWDAYAAVQSKLKNDKQLQTGGSKYFDKPYNSPPYTRIEVIISRAFEGMPAFQSPSLSGPVGERIYELRSYEGPTEKIFANKVQMFNQGDEIGLFKRLGFNAVFYSEVVAGSRMPNLMYMTSFNNLASREEHWKTFVADAEWKRLSGLPEYQHNVSRIEIFLLHPAEYSEI